MSTIIQNVVNIENWSSHDNCRTLSTIWCIYLKLSFGFDFFWEISFQLWWLDPHTILQSSAGNFTVHLLLRKRFNKQKENIATGETPPAFFTTLTFITWLLFSLDNFYHFITFITWSFLSLDNFYHMITFSLDNFFTW